MGNSLESKTGFHKSKAQVIDYWRAIEFFSPQTIPGSSDNMDADEPVFSFTDDETVAPWTPGHPFKNRQLQPDYAWRYQVYCGVFRVEKLKSLLEQKLGEDPESFDTRDGGESSVFYLSLSDRGIPTLDSLVVSSCAWALGRVIDGALERENGLAGFEDRTRVLIDGFSERLRLVTGNESGELSLKFLMDESMRMIKELGISSLIDKLEIRIEAVLVSSKKEFRPEDQDFLNSFFLKDLRRVSEEIQGNNVGPGLLRYLADQEEEASEQRIDVRRSPEMVFQQLSPKLFPKGRWPSLGHHPLVLSQQFAVNSVFGNLSERGGLFAVNGPPGTGKTTLLRDLVAAVVVERAAKLAQLTDAKDAFLHGIKYTWKTGEYTRTVSPWKDLFKGFEIVVASSNNTAVENITMEIPGRQAIDPSWLEGFDYFSDIASHIIGQPAWALMAARLGNKENRRKFSSHFWFGNADPKQESIPAIGFNERLKTVEPVDWKASVDRFSEAVEKECRIRERRESVHRACLEFEAAKKELLSLESKLADLDRQRKVFLEEVREAKRIEEELSAESTVRKERRLEHRKFKPGFFEIILTFGKSFKIWFTRDQELASVITHLESRHTQARDATGSRLRDLAETEADLERFFGEREKIRREQALREALLEQARRELGNSFPSSDIWKDENARELSSPWADPEWNDARAQVFLEAMRLHKAFILANADRIRKNLHAAIDILSGNAPRADFENAARTAEEAWTTLFFVVPVISTTFASFDRLFSHLGKEKLGWLLIDEAGQATPQATLGAVWRSKRTIVVGDPLQLEPVVTVPFTVQQILRNHFKVEERWLPGTTSVQELSDRVSPFGTYLGTQDIPIWVGSPLRVHRRCDRPMFDISNQVAYDGMMIFGVPHREHFHSPPSSWIDVDSAESIDHWIPSEGERAKELLAELFRQGISPEDILMITPFKSVAGRLKLLERSFGVKSGTIHTAQGKEADIVLLVLGGHPEKFGAKAWAARRPNLLNVAISRAKRRLFIIGNKTSWSRAQYFDIAARALK